MTNLADAWHAENTEKMLAALKVTGWAEWEAVCRGDRCTYTLCYGELYWWVDREPLDAQGARQEASSSLCNNHTACSENTRHLREWLEGQHALVETSFNINPDRSPSYSVLHAHSKSEGPRYLTDQSWRPVNIFGSATPLCFPTPIEALCRAVLALAETAEGEK